MPVFCVSRERESPRDTRDRVQAMLFFVFFLFSFKMATNRWMKIGIKAETTSSSSLNLSVVFIWLQCGNNSAGAVVVFQKKSFSFFFFFSCKENTDVE
jgi:hypothetical protein